MKQLIYWFCLTVAMLGAINSVFGQAASSCSIASYDSETGNLTLPCVQAGQESLNFSLKFVTPKTVGAAAGAFWTLSDFGSSDCQAVYGQCATIDENLRLTIPLEGLIEGVKHVALLKYYPTQKLSGFYWQYDNLQTIDLDSAILLTKGKPNPKGRFESLYLLDGHFAQEFDKAKAKDALALAKGVTLPKSKLKTGDDLTLRIFHFNDLHNELRTVHKTRGDTHRFSQMVKIVKEARAKAAKNEIVLFLSAGDDHIGNPFDELLGYEADSFQTDPAYRAYSQAGLDAAVIGNHELDRGSALFAKAIEKEAKFPILSANLYGSQNLTSDHYHPALIGMAKGLRIGIVGLTTRQETLLRQKDDPGLEAGDLLKTLENTLPYVEPLADVIILLTHVGYNGEVDGQIRHELEIGDVEIAETAAKMTDKPIMVIGGHMHLKLNEAGLSTVNKTVPIVQAGAKGSHLGEAVLSLFKTNSGWRSQLTAHLIPLKGRDDRVDPENPNYDNYEHDDDLDLEFEEKVMAPLYTRLDDKLPEVIGTAGSSPDLSTAKTIADRYVGETLMANFMNDAIVARSVNFPETEGQSQQVDIAVFNASGISSGIEPDSEITFNDWYGVMPFADIIVVTPMTGAQIKEMVMSNAQRIVRPEELEGDNPPDLTGYISRGFLHFSKELRYTIKLNNNAITVVAKDIILKGKPIEEQLNETFNVAFGDYISLRGGEGWNGEEVGAGLPAEVIGFDLASLPKNDTGLVYRNEIIAYIMENGVVDESTGAAKDGRLQVMP